MTEPPKTTGADSVVATLAGHGIDTLYCLPGVQNDAFFNALHDFNVRHEGTGGAIRPIHTRHEQGAAYMALGDALATGRPAAYSVVPGPGVLNTTAALATAWSTNASVLCLSGQIASRFIGRGHGMLHELPDQLGILERLTGQARRADRPEEAAFEVACAFRALKSGRPRPVALEIPPDVLAASGDFAAHPPLEIEPAPSVDSGLVAEAAALLERSERPLIVVGGGAQGAADWIRPLAERLQAPVLANRMGRGVLDERHPLSINLPTAHRLWSDCDVVLAIGTRLQLPLSWGADDRLKIVRVEIDPVESGRIRAPDVPLIGRAEDILPLLFAEVDRRGGKRPPREDDILALKAEMAGRIAKLDPQVPFLQAIREAIGEDGIVVDELTQVAYVARIAFPVYRPRSFISMGYQGTLGWGYPAGLGVKVARPEAPVVSINGDGGFMFAVQELSTAVRHAIPLVAVVFSDRAYGNVRRMQKEIHGNRVIASDLANPDFVRLAESFGVAGFRVRTPGELRTRLSEALALGEPVLIDVPCGEMPAPWEFLHMPKVRGGG